MKVIVVGGGPAGMRAALRARELGADVTLLESARLGGTAFNEGPAPVRTLARAARLRGDAAAFGTFGLEGPAPRVNLEAAIANANRIAAHANEVRHLAASLRQAGIEVVDEVGPARFVDRLALAVADGRRFEGDRVVLSVGGSPRKLPIPGNELALSFHDLWTLEALPGQVTVVGGASTGCQLASVLHDFGAGVDLVEAADRLVPQGDVDISTGLEAAFAARGINVLTGTRSERIEAVDGRLRLAYRRGGGSGWLESEAVFLAVGWPANVEPLHLEAAGVMTRGPYIAVDGTLRTNVPEIFAVGDVNGISMLVQSAALQGMVAAENAVLGARRVYTPHAVATGSFTDPEYGAVGLTEEEARASHDCLVEVVRYDDLPRAIIDARTNGLCKLIVDRSTRTLLGAHVLGSYSAEVIQVAATCMAGGMEITRIAELELAFPTFTEAIGIAARRIVRRLGLRPAEWTGNDIQEVPA
jgi:pyruvate/2-oxoglutarate dehydrogenase complex dihydrolipoamide dehydrogenase (E3) component